MELILEEDRTPAAYAALRASIGTQASVCNALGIRISTLSRRENGDKLVSIECVIALKWLKGEKNQSDEKTEDTITDPPGEAETSNF